MLPRYMYLKEEICLIAWYLTFNEKIRLCQWGSMWLIKCFYLNVSNVCNVNVCNVCYLYLNIIISNMIFILFPFFPAGAKSSISSEIVTTPGENVTLPCQLDIIFQNIQSLHWHHINVQSEGIPLYLYSMFGISGPQSSRTIGIVNHTTLILPVAQVEDEGSYVCKIILYQQQTIVQHRTYLHIISK